MNAEERRAIIAEYVLRHGSDHDRDLRAVLEEACPDCAGELAQAETALAPLALDVAPQQPPAALRQRVLARIAAEAGSTAAGSSAAAAPLATAPASSGLQGDAARRPSAQPRRNRPWAAIASPLLAVVVVVIWAEWRLGGELADQRQTLDTIRGDQATALTQMDDVVNRLKRTRALADGLRERDNQIAVLERRLRELERLKYADGGDKDLELASLREQLDIVRSQQLTVHELAASDQAGGSLRLFADHSGHRWMIAGDNLPSAGPDRCYELWMITSDGRKLASKTFIPDAEGRVRMMVDVPATMEMTAAAITDEPLGGVAEATGQVRYLAQLR